MTAPSPITEDAVAAPRVSDKALALNEDWHRRNEAWWIDNEFPVKQETAIHLDLIDARAQLTALLAERSADKEALAEMRKVLEPFGKFAACIKPHDHLWPDDRLLLRSMDAVLSYGDLRNAARVLLATTADRRTVDHG